VKYKKKPVIIEAIQWNGANCVRVQDWAKSQSRYSHEGLESIRWSADEDAILIETLEGTMKAMPWDYIICGIKGEFYPCKPDIFKASYEPLEANET
jgi:hypothetical protein